MVFGDNGLPEAVVPPGATGDAPAETDSQELLPLERPNTLNSLVFNLPHGDNIPGNSAITLEAAKVKRYLTFYY